MAATFGERELTYEELDVRFDWLAGYLGEMGIRRGAKSGPSPGALGSDGDLVFGILKAGAADVLIDPDDPEERVKPTPEEADIVVLLLSNEGSRDCGLGAPESYGERRGGMAEPAAGELTETCRHQRSGVKMRPM